MKGGGSSSARSRWCAGRSQARPRLDGHRRRRELEVVGLAGVATSELARVEPRAVGFLARDQGAHRLALEDRRVALVSGVEGRDEERRVLLLRRPGQGAAEVELPGRAEQGTRRLPGPAALGLRVDQAPPGGLGLGARAARVLQGSAEEERFRRPRVVRPRGQCAVDALEGLLGASHARQHLRLVEVELELRCRARRRGGGPRLGELRQRLGAAAQPAQDPGPRPVGLRALPAREALERRGQLSAPHPLLRPRHRVRRRPRRRAAGEAGACDHVAEEPVEGAGIVREDVPLGRDHERGVAVGRPAEPVHLLALEGGLHPELVAQRDEALVHELDHVRVHQGLGQRVVGDLEAGQRAHHGEHELGLLARARGGVLPALRPVDLAAAARGELLHLPLAQRLPRGLDEGEGRPELVEVRAPGGEVLARDGLLQDEEPALLDEVGLAQAAGAAAEGHGEPGRGPVRDPPLEALDLGVLLVTLDGGERLLEHGLGVLEAARRGDAHAGPHALAGPLGTELQAQRRRARLRLLGAPAVGDDQAEGEGRARVGLGRRAGARHGSGAEERGGGREPDRRPARRPRMHGFLPWSRRQPPRWSRASVRSNTEVAATQPSSGGPPQASKGALERKTGPSAGASGGRPWLPRTRRASSGTTSIR